MTSQQKAFLEMIAAAEIGPALLAVSDNGYNVIVGSTAKHPILFKDYSKHPRVRNADLNSDAAGRYQFMGRYWNAYRDLLLLQDFGHAAQDCWALQLVKECQALTDIEAGRIVEAIRKCRSRWASFPGAGYGQPERQVSELLTAFTSAGGVVS